MNNSLVTTMSVVTDREFEWVEMIEPQSQRRMYANLSTGECVWKPPPGVHIKALHNNQWWELFDKRTSCFYYYNAASQQTVWHRPVNADIIPLAKLQALKESCTADDEFELRNNLKDEGTQTLTKDFSKQRSSARWIQSSIASPQTSRKHVHGGVHRYPDISVDISAQMLPSSLPTDLGLRSPTHSAGSSGGSGHYGFVYRGDPSPQFAPPQRSLESPQSNAPRTCDILLDLERSSRGSSSNDAGNIGPGNPRITPDIMSRSCYGHLPASIVRDDALRFSGRATAAELQRRMDMTNPYAEMSTALAAQATPRPKPRVFPRTNPYVGVPRTDGFSTYRRPDEVYGGHVQRLYDTGHVEQGVYGLGLTVGPRNDYETLQRRQQQQQQQQQKQQQQQQQQHRPAITSHSFDITNSPTGHSLSDAVSTHEVVLRCRGDDGRPSHLAARRNSEPFYVNIPFSGLRGKIPCGAAVEVLPDQLTDDDMEEEVDGRDSFPAGITVDKKSRKISVDIGSLSEFVVDSSLELNLDESITEISADKLLKTGDRDSDRLSDHSTGSVFLSAPTPQVDLQQPVAPQQQPAPDLLRRFVGSGQQDSNPERTQRATDLLAVTGDKTQSLPVERSLAVAAELQQQQRPLSTNVVMASPAASSAVMFSTPALQRRIPGKFYSESDGDAYVSDRLVGLAIRTEKNGEREQQSVTEFDLEEFVASHLNDHRKGLLGRHVPVEALLTWTKDAIRKPIIRSESKLVKKEAAEVFRRIQMYMGDRSIGAVGKTVTSPLELVVDIVMRGWTTVALRDEIYIQLCRQITRNPQQDSLQRGLELMCVCLAFFPPSSNFLPYLQLHLTCPVDSIIAQCRLIVECLRQCHRRLEKIIQTGPKVGVNKPTQEDIELALKSIYTPSMFGCTLTEVMAMQHDRFPRRRLPWIQTTLSEEILRLNGVEMEGIFRVPGDTDTVNVLKARCDSWCPVLNCTDPCVAASLLKLWYRELYEPLIPFDFYDECVGKHDDIDGAISIVDRLPPLNRDVFKYLVRFLQVFAASENVSLTKMDVNNLAMVMAPNCLRNRRTSPQLLLENTRREMGFMRTLIENLDTTDMEGVV